MEKAPFRATGLETGFLVAMPLLFLVLAVAAEYLGWDVSLERWFYDPVANVWPYRDGWLTQSVMHSGGRAFFDLVGVIQLGLIASSFRVDRLKPWRKLLTCTLLGMTLGPLVVGYLKAHTHIFAPWDLRMFGGPRPYIKMFQPAPPGLPMGHAFPAGHSAGGFMLMTLYISLRHFRPRWRFLGLSAGLIGGFLLGLAQQARGAHFLSHDFVTLSVCWLSMWLVFVAFYGRDAASGVAYSGLRHSGSRWSAEAVVAALAPSRRRSSRRRTRLNWP